MAADFVRALLFGASLSLSPLRPHQMKAAGKKEEKITLFVVSNVKIKGK